MSASALFNELPFHVVSNEIPDPFEELFVFVKQHMKFKHDNIIFELLNKYLGMYLQKIYGDIYREPASILKAYPHVSCIVDEDGNTLLHHFAVLRYYELVEFVLTKLNINPNIHNYGKDYDTNRDDPGKTALMCVIEMVWNEDHKQEYLDICELLVKNDADWTQIFRSSFLIFNGQFIVNKFNKDEKNNAVDKNIDKNIIELLNILNKKHLVDLNVKCVQFLRKRFGRRTDPEGFGERSSYYHIECPKYSQHKYNNGKTLLYLAMVTGSNTIVNWLIKNGAELFEYPEYKQNRILNIRYLKIKKDYLFQRRKHLLLLTNDQINNKYLSSQLEVREILSYI